MNQKTNNRMQMLTAMAIFIAAVFIWGIVQWQATGVKEPAVQKALATQKKVNNVSDKKVNIEALTKILLQDIKYETKLNLMDDSVVEGIVSLQKDSKAALYWEKEHIPMKCWWSPLPQKRKLRKIREQ